MPISLAEIVTGAAFLADMQNSDRVLQGEWVALMNKAIKSCWNLAAIARPDFQFASSDFTLASGGSASVDTRTFRSVPNGSPDFHSLIDVVFAPDTAWEYSLGPFAWQNRRAPGGWQFIAMLGLGFAGGGSRASLRGNLIYVEPSLQAAGSYRAWYCPKPHTPEVIVRLATTAALPACTAAGAGVAKTLTANAAGVLTVDGAAADLGDLILVKDQAATQNNGVYVLTTLGTGAVAWVLTRAPTFAATTDVGIGDIVAVGQTDDTQAPGALNEATFWTVATFTAIEAALTFSAGGYLEPILDQFLEVVQIKTAIPAMMRDGGTATTSLSDYRKRLEGEDGKPGLVGEMKNYFALVRSQGPSPMIDTDMVGGAGWGRWSV